MSSVCQQSLEELMKIQSPEQWAEDFESLAARGMSIRDKAMTYQQQVEQNKRIMNAIRLLTQAGSAASV